jgi:hypothetical protein
MNRSFDKGATQMQKEVGVHEVRPKAALAQDIKHCGLKSRTNAASGDSKKGEQNTRVGGGGVGQSSKHTQADKGSVTASAKHKHSAEWEAVPVKRTWC